MKNKIMLTIVFAIVAMLAIVASASAIVPNYAPCANCIGYGYASYGSYPVNPSLGGRQYPYAETPVRVGGDFGQNSWNIIGIKPGFYDTPRWNSQYLSSPFYPRVGGYGYGYRSGYGYGPGAYYNYPGTFRTTSYANIDSPEFGLY